MPPGPILYGSYMIGSVIGHYEIVEKLGEGGMGVVFKARDTSLNRFVAIKLLPAGKAGDESRIRRFTQEARTASALNHPNIVTIHEISSHNGAPFIVMEFVPGKALDRLIPRNGMRLSEVFKIGTQIASALAAAAAAGVIHRDVKPGNVMVTDAGHVKVLDFGLAKLSERAVSADQATATMAAVEPSREGAVVGTASYMSPEQAEGKPVDPRSDIFSFGAVLYEMTTGQRAFRGDTAISTLSAILRDEPKPLSQIATGIPRDLEKIINRCLRKDPERRFQNMADVRVALLELKEESESGSLLEAPPAYSRKRTWVWAGVGAAVLASLAAGLWLVSRQTASIPQQSLVQVTTYPGSEVTPCFSPDGKQIAFSWDGGNDGKLSIYVKLLGENDALRLTTSPTADVYPTWAPDGKRIAFRRAGSDGGIYTVSALGGTERKLTGLATSGQISWSPDGKWLAISSPTQNDRGIFLLSVEGGEPRRITNPKPPTLDQSPAFALDGHQLAYAACALGPTCDVYVQPLSPGYDPQGAPRQIAHQGTNVLELTWSHNGRSLIYAAWGSSASITHLWQAGIDGREAPKRLEIAGPQASSPSASPTANRLVFSRELLDPDIWRYQADGGIEPLIVSSHAVDDNPQFSPDGSKIAFESARSGEIQEIWVAQADGSKPVQMTNHVGRQQGTPRWSPDGRWIGFDSKGQDGHWSIYIMESTGSTPRRITSESVDESMPFWSRDGKWLYFRSIRTGRSEIWRIPFAGGPQEQVTKNGGFTAYESADGQTLFYTKAFLGPLYARPLTGGEERELLPYVLLKAFMPVADGIYYIGRRTEGKYYPLAFFRFSDHTSRLLANIDGTVYQGLSVSPDQKTILFSKSVSSGADLMMIENFQ